MSLVVEAEPVPIKLDDHGVARVGGTRVVLDLVINAYLDGATPEQIADDYDAVSLADVYAVIAFYLRHRTEVDAYLKGRADEGEKIRQEIESNYDRREWRERLIARHKNLQANGK